MMRRSAYRHSPLREKRKKKRTLFAALGFVVVIVLVFIIARAPFFKIEDIEIVGARAVSASAIKTVAKAELAGSSFFIFPKNNIFWFPKKEVAKKISEYSGTIQSVSVGLSLPKKITVTIDEFTPEAIICGEDDVECFLLDGGFSFATTSTRVLNGTSTLLFIKTETPLNLSIKKQLISSKQFGFIANLSQKLLQNNIPVEYSTLRTDGDYYVRVVGGADLYFSENISVDDAIKNAQTLLTSEIFKKENLLPPEGFKKIDYIDLRFGTKLFYKTNAGNTYENTP
jgi:hypothetical protein